MTESALKAILRLFATVSQLLDDDNLKPGVRKIMEAYLREYLSADKVTQYLYIFNFYCKEFAERRKIKTRDKDTLFTIKAVIICEQVNKVLLVQHRFLVIFQMLDILALKKTLTDADLDFLRALSLAFHIDDDSFALCKNFVFSPVDEIPVKEQILIVDNSGQLPGSGFRYLNRQYIRGRIVILHLSKGHSYVFRYYGQNEQFYVNGRPVEQGRTYTFDKGSFIHNPVFGKLHFSEVVKHFSSSNAKGSLMLNASDVAFRFRNSDKGISPFSLIEAGGQMIGVMGASGSGKSTLINLLNGNLQPAEGKILLNGYHLVHEKSLLKGIIGYIPQDDLLIEELTVYENLWYNARLCFNQMSPEEINTVVNAMLDDIGLYEARNLRVGSPLKKIISGGQRKRLNISLELIREPSVLFVDEPTSGLSSTDSEIIMEMLKEQAIKGKLVIVNIHQPSSDIFKLFDKLIVLDKGGHIIYQGTPVEAITYFKSHNQLINADSGECGECGTLNPDQILQVVEMKKVNEEGNYSEERLVAPDEWYRLYRKNIDPDVKAGLSVKITLPESLLKVPEMAMQLVIFFQRNLKSKLADRQYLLINLLEAPLLAFILAIFTRYNKGSQLDKHAYIFSENMNFPVYIFMAVIVALFIGMMVSAEEIIRDRRIIQRESFLSLSRFSYYNSKVLYLLFLSLGQTFIFVIIGNSLLGVKGMLVPYWFVLFSAAVFSNLVGLNISDNLKSVVTIYILIPIILVPQILLGGAMVKFDKLNSRLTSQEHVPLIGDLMASRWCYEALSVHQFSKNRYQRELFEAEKMESEAHYHLNYFIPELELRLSQIGGSERSDSHTTIITNSINQLVRVNLEIPDPITSLSINEKMLTQQDSDWLTNFFRQLRRYYSSKLNKAVAHKDSVLRVYELRLGGRDNLLAFKRLYHNEQLADFVTNRRETEKILLYRNKYIQKADPIYFHPADNLGRAHFFAAEKRIGHVQIDTYWFNLGVIWLMNMVLYGLLQFGAIRKAIIFLQTMVR